MSRSEVPLCFKVIVVSDRVAEGTLTDVSGELATKLLRENGFCVTGKLIIRNSYREIVKAIRSSGDRVLLFLGGTGPSPRDITVDVIESAAWRCLPGFGEIFRHLSYREIGANSLLTRTTLCILYDGKIAVALPGSPNAVRLGVELLSQVVNHLIIEIDKFEITREAEHCRNHLV